MAKNSLKKMLKRAGFHPSDLVNGNDRKDLINKLFSAIVGTVRPGRAQEILKFRDWFLEKTQNQESHYSRVYRSSSALG